MATSVVGDLPPSNLPRASPLTPSNSTFHKTISPTVQEGRVAERVSQLQARLTNHEDRSPMSPTKSLGGSLANPLSRYSTSRLMLSPKDVPLPGTPITIDPKYRRPIMAPTQESSKRRHSMKTSMDNGVPNIHQTPASRSVKAGSSSSWQCHMPFKSAQEELPSRLPRPVYEGVSQSSFRNAEGPLTTSSKPSNDSPVRGAYAKLLPFMPSPPDYIPRRHSITSVALSESSPTKIKSEVLPQNDEAVSVVESGTSPSLRRSNPRSLRRRTFRAQAEGSPDRQITHEHLQAESTRETSNLQALEDVFAGPIRSPQQYHVEPIALAGENTIGFSEEASRDAHDIHNPHYKPSVMPGRIHSRSMLRHRHGRSASTTAEQKGLPPSMDTAIVQDESQHHELQDGINPAYNSGITNLCHPEDTEDLHRYSSTEYPTSTESISHVAHAITDGTYDITHQPLPRRGHAVLLSTSPARRVPLLKHPVWLTSDGLYSSSEADDERESTPKTINVSVSGKSKASRIPRPVSAFSSCGGTCSNVDRVLNNLPVRSIHNRRDRGLQVVVTVAPNIENVVKVEVHPSPKSELYKHSEDKENTSLQETTD